MTHYGFIYLHMISFSFQRPFKFYRYTYHHHHLIYNYKPTSFLGLKTYSLHLKTQGKKLSYMTN